VGSWGDIVTEDLVGRILTGGSVGVIATLLLVIWLLLTERLVIGSVFRRMEARLAVYETMAVKALELAERASGKA
jgi:hypothetical protein